MELVEATGMEIGRSRDEFSRRILDKISGRNWGEIPEKW